MSQPNEKIVPAAIKNNGFSAAITPQHESPGEQEFRANLIQKIRTPLNTIIGFAELMARRPTAVMDPDVHHILQAARELLEIANRELGDPSVPPQTTPNLVAPITCDVLYIEDDLVNFTLVERILEFRPELKL